MLRWASAVIGLMLYLFPAVPGMADEPDGIPANNSHAGYGPLSVRI